MIFKSASLKLTVLLFLLLKMGTIQAQFAVTGVSDAQALAQQLLGQGAVITNAVLTCGTPGLPGAGIYTSGRNTVLNSEEGIVLTTGLATNVAQAAIEQASTPTNNSGDNDLNQLSSSALMSRDKCILEFDVIPNGYALQFKYIFGSEEYPEFVCSHFVDVFAFFVSGPNPNGGQYNKYNIAQIPNSPHSVSVNSINPGTAGFGYLPSGCVALSNSHLYISNDTSQHVVYDGLTVPLIAEVAVIPNATYHFKIAIADVSDQSFDSGVFLESLNGVMATLSNQNRDGSLDYVEGCEGGYLKITLSQPMQNDYTFHMSTGGTAFASLDYTLLPSQITVPAGDTVVFIPVQAIEDTLLEGTETLVLYLLYPNSNDVYDSVVVNIQESAQPFTIAPPQQTLCDGEMLSLCAPDGYLQYSWSTSHMGMCIQLDGETTVGVTVTDAQGCTFESVPLEVDFHSLPVAQITATDNVLAAPNAWGYQWYVGGIAIQGANSQTFEVLQSGDYTVEVTDENGCSAMSASYTVVFTDAGSINPQHVLKVYPNPSTNKEWFVYSPAGGAYKVTTADGRVVQQGLLEVGRNAIRLEGQAFVHFLYLEGAMYKLMSTN